MAGRLPVFALAGGLTNSRNLEWDTPGLKTIIVQVLNQASVMTDTLMIDIRMHEVHIPLIQRK
jgi:hypothetical protein